MNLSFRKYLIKTTSNADNKDMIIYHLTMLWSSYDDPRISRFFIWLHLWLSENIWFPQTRISWPSNETCQWSLVSSYKPNYQGGLEWSLLDWVHLTLVFSWWWTRWKRTSKEMRTKASLVTPEDTLPLRPLHALCCWYGSVHHGPSYGQLSGVRSLCRDAVNIYLQCHFVRLIHGTLYMFHRTRAFNQCCAAVKRWECPTLRETMDLVH